MPSIQAPEVVRGMVPAIVTAARGIHPAALLACPRPESLMRRMANFDTICSRFGRAYPRYHSDTVTVIVASTGRAEWYALGGAA